MGLIELSALDPARYTPHALHATTREFRETNCYVDLLIELLHAHGLEPTACLGFTLAVGLEGDQWTFFKPSHAELERLYGLRIEELSLYRPLPLQIETQLALGRVVMLEADAFHMPDVAGSDYRTAHAKTTIGVTALDAAARRLVYFHNAGLFELRGEDYDGLFAAAAAGLPPYCEIARLDRLRVLPAGELRAEARTLLRAHLGRRPSENPIAAYARVFGEHEARLQREGMGAYHAYSFVALRQLGAAFELGAAHLAWLSEDGELDLREPAARLQAIALGAKSLILKLARVVASGRPSQASSLLGDAARAWDEAMSQLDRALAP